MLCSFPFLRDVAMANIFWLSIHAVHIGATRRIRLYRPCAAAMQPYVKLLWPLVMAVLRIADADIIFCTCGFYLLLLFFLTYSQRLEIGCLPHFHRWCGLTVNLECRSEMCCTRLAENTGRKNYAKNRHLCTIAQLCRAMSSQIRHVSTIGKKTC